MSVVKDVVGGEEVAEGNVGYLLATAFSSLIDDHNIDSISNISSLNSSTESPGWSNGGGTTHEGRVVRHLRLPYQILITFCYVFGIMGNIAALYIINKNETQRYRKQTFMLRCLAGNDLLALCGSFVQMYMHLYLPVANTQWFCAFRVLWRAFGLGSGCVALVMALERWLALTHPFTYQKHVTYAVIRRTILGLWSGNLLLVCAPFLGFGLWYDEASTGRTHCVRYREATTPKDKVYAYVVFALGIAMCLVIVCCNLAVIRVLCRMRERLMPRRHSRASCRSSTSIGDQPTNHATVEELSFARLMGVLSIFFVVCWVPQLMTIVVAQLASSSPSSNFGSKVYRIADIFIALNFTLDPYVYVLFRRHRRCGNRHLRKLKTYFCPSRLQNLPNRDVSASVRSSSHLSNSAGSCRQLPHRESRLLLQGRTRKTQVRKTQCPPIWSAVKGSMFPSNSYSPSQTNLQLTLLSKPTSLPTTPHQPTTTTMTLSPTEISMFQFEIKKPTETLLINESEQLHPSASNSSFPSRQQRPVTTVRVTQVGEDLIAVHEITKPVESKEEHLAMPLNDPKHPSDAANDSIVFSDPLPPILKRWSFCYGEDEKERLWPLHDDTMDTNSRTNWMSLSWHKMASLLAEAS